MDLVEKYLNESLKGQFGKAGFLSKDPISYEDFFELQQFFMQNINLELLDNANKGTGIGKKLTKLQDMRVDVELDNANRLMIQYPFEIIRDKKLQDFYKKIVSKWLKKI